MHLRLSFVVPYLSRWSEAISLLSQPQNLLTSLKKLAFLIDEIWYHAGDTTTDQNWYIKRALLTGVYTSTELHMLTDASDKQTDTWAFLERRIDDIVIISQFQSSAEQFLSHVGNAFVHIVTNLNGNVAKNGKVSENRETEADKSKFSGTKDNEGPSREVKG